VFSKLLDLNNKIIYKKGVENKVVDALARRGSVDAVSDQIVGVAGAEYLAMSVWQSQCLMQVLASYEHDDYTRDVLAKLAIDGVAVQHFSMHQGLLRYKSKIWVGCDVQLQQKLISACHASALGVTLASQPLFEG
jgi:hypothetical protein